MGTSPRPPNPTFSECRRAYRSVRRSPFGRAAVAANRPRSVTGLTRDRAPLPVQIYAAARQGTLIWRSPDSFALLRPPGGAAPRLPELGSTAKILSALDRHWAFVTFLAPPVVGLCLALLIALVSPMAAVITVLISVGWVTLLQVSTVTKIIVDVAILIGKRRLPVAESNASEQVADEFWSVSLCHAETDGEVVALLEAAQQQRRADTLIILRQGLTTEAARTAPRVLAERLGEDAGIYLMAKQDYPTLSVPDPQPRAGISFVATFVCGVGAALAATALFVSETERAACAQECSGRPATYSTALAWLLRNLLLIPGGDAGPATLRARVIGVLFVALGAVTMAVLLTALIRTPLRNEQREIESSIVRRWNGALALSRVRDTVSPPMAVVAFGAVAIQVSHFLHGLPIRREESPG
ncbi:hypothetical protein [Actinoplanes aureus]|uniref:Uncharacterized protein n=1 Tax=Actinoplanes aureus TaxID=2792083 RepID=A0A931FYR7_9ACTN|nr:hypothetical protein [Actinoplanes aureus]MBG0562201.1 hypothetical protein [Actinoplanes aureus]